MEHSHIGVVTHPESLRPTDYLFRISIKCLVRNAGDKVLAVKETGREWWDLPGGGMDHGETIHEAIAREMHEEVHLQGDFAYRIISAEDPNYLDAHNFWQMRLIVELTPESMNFSPGDDADEIAFIDSGSLANSTVFAEQKLYEYSRLAQ